MSGFAERLKELRLQSGAKQTDIAAYLGVQPRTIRFYEEGQREPSLENLAKLAVFYQTSIDYLLGLTDIEKSYPRG